MDQIFTKYNLRKTKQRVAILAALSKIDKPVSYQQIETELAMDKATFYRNIEKLEGLGIVTKIELGDRWYFEIYKTKHSHFICKECNYVECLQISPNLLDYEVETALFKGLCKSCHTDAKSAIIDH